MSDREKREPGAIWGGWWFWEPPAGKTKEPSEYISQNVFDGKRPLSPEREALLRRKAEERLKDYKGVLLSLTPEQHRAISEMDPGPPASVGRPFFECPGCGKDIAADTPHKEGCPRA